MTTENNQLKNGVLNGFDSRDDAVMLPAFIVYIKTCIHN